MQSKSEEESTLNPFQLHCGSVEAKESMLKHQLTNWWTHFWETAQCELKGMENLQGLNYAAYTAAGSRKESENFVFLSKIS